MERGAGPCRDRRVARPAPDLLHPALQDAAVPDDRQRRRRPVPRHGPRGPPGRRLGLLPELLALGHVPHAGDAARPPAARARAGHRALDVPAPRRGRLAAALVPRCTGDQHHGGRPRHAVARGELRARHRPRRHRGRAVGLPRRERHDDPAGRRRVRRAAQHRVLRRARPRAVLPPRTRAASAASSRSTATAARRRSSSRSPTRASALRPSARVARAARRSSTRVATGATSGTRTSSSRVASRAWSTRSARRASSSRCPS